VSIVLALSFVVLTSLTCLDESLYGFALSFVVLTSLTCLDESLYIARQGLPMEMLLDGLDGLSLARMS
jgi:hypothetical protein